MARRCCLSSFPCVELSLQYRAVLFQDTVVMVPTGIKRNIPTMMDFVIPIVLMLQ